MKMTAFRDDIASCGPVEVADASEVRTSIIALMMESVRTSETSICFNNTTRWYIPEGCHPSLEFARQSIHIHLHRKENMKPSVKCSRSIRHFVIAKW
jgi:hypothetical protein